MKRIAGRLLGGASVLVGVVVIIVVILLLIFSSQFFYFFEQVEEQEVGVQLEGGRIKEIVGPGVYSDAGLYVKLVRVSSEAILFSVQDDEIITKDKQRIGLVVSGDLFRPDLSRRDVLRARWALYRPIYLDNVLIGPAEGPGAGPTGHEGLRGRPHL